MIAHLALAVAAAGAAEVSLPVTPSERVEWQRGETPVMLVLPRRGEGWRQLAARVTGSAGRVGDLREENPGMRAPLRDVRVRVPWELLAADLRAAAVRAIFPADRRVTEGWQHVVSAPWRGDPETWWEMALLFCAEGAAYHALREANPDVPMFPPRGTRVLIPNELLIPELRRLPPVAGVVAAPTPLPAVFDRASPPSSRPAEPRERSMAPATSPGARTPVPGVATAGTGAGAPESGPLEYHDGYAVYRLRAGEALYSAVVVRFTGELHAADVNTLARDLALRSGVSDVTAIPIGHSIHIPYDVLLPEYLPPRDPRRVAWEKGREELALIQRAIRAANLDGIHVILDAGHGGEDTGAVAHGAWEATYVYDVMHRIERVLERETKATVWTTVRDQRQPDTLGERDVLPQSRRQRLLVQPAYDLSDSSTGVQLRWVLSNAILARLQKQKVDPERVVFVSIHADSLHPAVRGLMVYVPSRSLRPARGPSPASIYDCAEAREAGQPTFSASFRSRAEALSGQLGDTIVKAAARYDIPVHPFQPVRNSVLRGGGRWVPAVLRYNKVPTSVLVELCNLNNEEDRKQLLTWRFREKLAHAIAAGLAEGFSR